MTRKYRYKNRIFNCKASSKAELDWRMSSATAAGHLPKEPKILDELDLRKNGDGWWSIGSQEETGSCVGWAVADSVLRFQFAEAGRIKKDEKEKLSVRYLWMAAKETDEFTDRPTTFIESYGTSIKAALGIVYKYGIVLDKDLPFKLDSFQQESSFEEETAPLYLQEESAFYAAAAKLRISAYFNLDTKFNLLNSEGPEHNQKILDGWKAWLCTNGPIATRLDVDQTWFDLATTDNKKDGLLDNYTGSIGLEGHACALVGYTKDNLFIVRNSWGKEWGDDGYAYATPNYALDAFTEAYGVVVEKGLAS